ncbi:hypothetical protein, partial [Klebsiella variicola]|uniref:hypothetical protein n=1 Tax=Klebsiella variicola TaxID=244366 RepID=UPI002731A90C
QRNSSVKDCKSMFNSIGESCPQWLMIATLGGSSYTMNNARVWNHHFGKLARMKEGTIMNLFTPHACMTSTKLA